MGLRSVSFRPAGSWGLVASALLCPHPQDCNRFSLVKDQISWENDFVKAIVGDRNEASLHTTVAFLLKEKVRERTIPLGNHEDLAPNLHLCKKHDSDFLKNEKGQRCSPLVPQRDTMAAKSTRKSSESPLRFCAWSQRGSVASLLKGRAQSLLSARSTDGSIHFFF